MRSPKHWQDALNVVLSVWLIASPSLLGYQDEMVPVVNAFLVGVVLLGVALGAIFAPRAWEEWTETVLGLWLVVSPFVLDFADNRPALLCASVTGALVIALSLWTLLTDHDYRGWRRKLTAR